MSSWVGAQTPTWMPGLDRAISSAQLLPAFVLPGPSCREHEPCRPLRVTGAWRALRAVRDLVRASAAVTPAGPGHRGAGDLAGAAWASARCPRHPFPASPTSGAWESTGRESPLSTRLARPPAISRSPGGTPRRDRQPHASRRRSGVLVVAALVLVVIADALIDRADRLEAATADGGHSLLLAAIYQRNREQPLIREPSQYCCRSCHVTGTEPLGGDEIGMGFRSRQGQAEGEHGQAASSRAYPWNRCLHLATSSARYRGQPRSSSPARSR